MNVVSKTESDQVIHLKVSWNAYQALAESLGEASSTRLAYSGEILEIMSPGSKHERIAARISYLLSSVVTEWNFNIEDTRSTTFTTEAHGGFEGDDSYYIASAAKVHDWDNIDLSIDPPPDLVIEVDITNRRMDKAQLYASIGVSEFWRYDDEAGLAAFVLTECKYVAVEVSQAIPGLPIREIGKRLNQKGDRRSIVAEWQQWLRDNRHLHTDR